MSASAAKAWSLLTARGAQLEGNRGGIPELTGSEVARMLKGLPVGPFYAGMLRESGDVRCLTTLEILVWTEAVRFLHRRDAVRPYCRAMAGVAVYEFLFPRALKCDTCNGRGWVKQDGQGVECSGCGNAGGTKLTPEMRALLLGVPIRQWDRYSGFYEEVHAIVQGWHGQAIRHLTRALRDDAEEM